MKTIYLDDYARAGKNDVTRIDEGYVSADSLLRIRSSIQDENFFIENPTGRMSPESFNNLRRSLRAGWDENKPVTIFVEQDGSVTLHEGNHRLHACLSCNEFNAIDVFIEVRYFGNAQNKFSL